MIRKTSLISAALLLGAVSVAFEAPANLVNLETGEGYRPTIDEDGNLEEPPDWVQNPIEYGPNEYGPNEYGPNTSVDTWPASGTATIRGTVVYNDRRQHGLFSTRDDLDGDPGERCTPDGRRDDGRECLVNWLGARYMVVDVIEIDQGYFGPTAWNCRQEELIASVPVNRDGSFTVTFDPYDPCRSDSRSRTAIELRVRTRYCGAWCFSVVDKRGDPYTLSYPGATNSDPLLIDWNDDIELPAMAFSPAATNAAIASDIAIAANYYASLVDTILTVHEHTGIPFYYDEFGEVSVEYPSTRTKSGTALSPGEIALIDRDDWVIGEIVAHEYGHVLMQRAWDGGYGWDGVGNGGVDWDKDDPTDMRIAFKEGFGNFVSRAVFTETMPCDAAGFDDNERKPLPGSLGQGAQYVTNVNKLLCDWLDARRDPATGIGDRFTAELYSIWYNVRRMYLDRLLYGGDFKAGLTICDYVDYYLAVRKAPWSVGLEAHLDYVQLITELIYNNNIACNRPAP